jgi:hypothetical protein
MTWQTGAEVELARKRSPISRIAEMPAWEGSHAGRYLEHDPIYSIGAIAGAFLTVEGVDIDEVIENV